MCCPENSSYLEQGVCACVGSGEKQSLRIRFVMTTVKSSH